MKDLSKDAIANLRGKLQGAVILPEDDNYDEVREIWNAMIDRKPAAIVRCGSTEDVAPAIQFARENELEISIRGGGHNIAGKSMCNDGLVIDLSQLKGVQVDPVNQVARVEPGATLGDFDAATLKHGLATPVGVNSTTGIAGLTLGGGFGWLTRKYGMTVDNLVSADLVTANGEKLHLSADEHSNLFWAIRGGGGNFGIVTQFEYALHPVGPELLSGLMVFPIEEAKQILERYREFVETSPEELTVWVILRKAPALPFLPENVHGKEVLVLAICYSGDPVAGKDAIQPLEAFGNPHGIHVGVMPFVAWQQAFDPMLTPGSRNYWKSHNLTELEDGFIEKSIEYTGKLPSPHCEIFFGHIAGYVNRVPWNATAYAHRDAKFVINVHGRWDTEAEDSAGIAWARSFFNDTLPFASAGVYINFMTEEEEDRIGSAYGANYDRLAELKLKYDPDNVFHMNQNIKP